MAYLKLSERLRNELKKPLGKIYSGAGRAKIEGIMIAIGDATSEEMIKLGLRPKICIYDGVIERRRVGVSDAIQAFEAKTVRLENPAGTLNEDAFKAIEEALRGEGSYKIEVDGEEDLVALAAVDVAPVGTVVAYGQPKEGMVIAKIDKKTKQRIKDILEEMRNENRRGK